MAVYHGTIGGDVISGTGRVDQIYGRDSLTGLDRVSDTLFGRGGNDALFGDNGADRLFGGGGDDGIDAGDFAF